MTMITDDDGGDGDGDGDCDCYDDEVGGDGDALDRGALFAELQTQRKFKAPQIRVQKQEIHGDPRVFRNQFAQIGNSFSKHGFEMLASSSKLDVITGARNGAYELLAGGARRHSRNHDRRLAEQASKLGFHLHFTRSSVRNEARIKRLRPRRRCRNR